MNVRKTLTVALALVTAAVLAGCSGTSTPAQSSAPSATSASAPPAQAVVHNDADATFARAMIPHHTQAVRMAELASGRAGSAQVKQLASAIQAAQQPEIDQLSAMLKAWGEPASAAGTSSGMDHGMDHGMDQSGMSGMSGMMTEQQMTGLGQLSGAEFDRRFLTMMISHHEGAVAMSADELRDGANAEATALARKITDAQRAEIDQMRRLLAAG